MGVSNLPQRESTSLLCPLSCKLSFLLSSSLTTLSSVLLFCSFALQLVTLLAPIPPFAPLTFVRLSIQGHD